jgi:hypothetical protein
VKPGGSFLKIPRLARVEFDDQLLVDDGIDFLAGRYTDDLSAECFLVDEEPIRSLDDLGLVKSALGETLGAILGAY